MLVVVLAVLAVGGWLISLAFQDDEVTTLLWVGIVAVIVVGVMASGFVINPPNIAKVVTFFGRYLGTVRRNGLVWTYPVTRRERVSLRIQNFDSETLKVNDANGNPIEVAAVIVWWVVDTAQAAFEVEDYEDFVEIMRTQLRRLAYAPEIAADMLRRQQAEAVVAARTRIVEGAVGMVDHALEMLSAKHIVELDEERKAAMVSNLLVVLCSEHHAQPVLKAGTLYQ
jgi:regulator of protease activity HflC (stomatin/prohibitin superfamily)